MNIISSNERIVITNVADVRLKPSLTSSLDTQLLYGEKVFVIEQNNDWTRIKRHDSESYHHGYVLASSLGVQKKPATHRLKAVRSVLYGKPDIKSFNVGCLSIGSQLAISEFLKRNDREYAKTINEDFIVASHITPLDHHEKDFVRLAERMLHTPYLWGGTSAFGIDCSGLVKLVMNMCGHRVFRDSIDQEKSIGIRIDAGDLRRGDFVFWKGHVGIMRDEEFLLHANAYSMSLICEPLSSVIKRIGPVKVCKRPDIKNHGE